MGTGHQKPSFNHQLLNNPRLNKNIIKRKIFDGIDSPSITLNLWMNLVNYDYFLTQQEQKIHANYEKLSQTSCQWIEMIQKDIPRTFSDEKHLQSPQNHSMLQRVLVALSNRFPQIGYISGMSFYVQRVLQIAPQQKGYHILVWLYLNDPVIYNLASGKQAILAFIQVVNEMVNKQCPKLGAVLKHIDISIGVFCVTWIRSLFSLVCDKPIFQTIFSLALLQGSKIWVLATIALIKCMEQPIMKSNRSDVKIIEITSSRDPLKDLETKQTFLSFLEQLLEKYKVQIDTHLHKIANIVPLDQQCESKHSQLHEIPFNANN